MARKLGKRNSRYLARLVTEDRAPCAFCHRQVDDEITYGKLYAIGDIQCHYFCALLSCCLVQKGSDEDGLFGFMYKDILAELERSKKHKCSYCCRGGANLGCSVSSCRKQFHLPCGRERDAVSLYYGTYKSFCRIHAPAQVIPEHIMCKARLRMRDSKKQKCPKPPLKYSDLVKGDGDKPEEEMVCLICYEAVDAFPTVNTFWPPCCARDAWFHRSCVQRMALNAGMHYLKCPLCNDKANFYDAVVGQGYYVPDRDAAWELEQNAFADIYERPLTCTVEECQCPLGRGHDSDQGSWDIKLCLLCGSVGAHTKCIGASATTRYICLTCTPAAPKDIQALANTIEELIQQEQANAANTVRHGPVMPSRMSLRRTKGRVTHTPSSSRAHDVKREIESPARTHIQASRQELNLSTPRKFESTRPRDSCENENFNFSMKIKDTGYTAERQESLKSVDPYKSYGILVSPMKMLENSFREKVLCMGVNNAVLDEQIVDLLKSKFKKPRPLSEKRRIVEDILDGMFNNMDALKRKEPPKEWVSPRKSVDIPNGIQTTSENTSKSYDATVENTLETPKMSKRVTAPNIIVVIPENLSIDEIKHENDQDVIDCSKTSNKEEIIPNTEELSKVINEIDNEPKSNSNAEHTEQNENENLKNIKIENLTEIHEAIEDNNSRESSKETATDKTFEMASELVAETLGNVSFVIDAHKRKTVDIQHDSSLEISENDQSINIDVIKLDDSLNVTNDTLTFDDKKKKCAFKFSPLDKEKLERTNVDIDLESFKKEYLNEVDREFKCCFNHKHDTANVADKMAYRSAIDFAVDAALKNCKKRKLSEGSLVLKYEMNEVKRRKISENDLNLDKSAHQNDSENVAVNLAMTSVKNTKKITKQKRKHCKSKKRAGVTRKTRAKENERSHTKATRHKARNEEKHLKDKLQGENEVLFIETELKDQAVSVNDEINKTKVKAKKRDEPKCLKHKTKEKYKKLLERKCRKDKKGELKNEVGEMIKEKHVKDIHRKEGRIKGLRNEEKRDKSKMRAYKNKGVRSKGQKRDRHSENIPNNRQADRNIEVTIDQEETQRKFNKKKKIKTKLSISNDDKDISVKIKWKKKQLRLKIESKKVKTVEEHNSKLKQYVLQYYPETTPKEVLVKPEKDVNPLKRKYVKQEKFSPDKFKQMSIQNFFKVKTYDEK